MRRIKKAKETSWVNAARRGEVASNSETEQPLLHVSGGRALRCPTRDHL